MTAPSGLTYAQAAEALGVSKSTVQRAAYAGKFPVRRLTKRTVLIDPADLWTWWEASKVTCGQKQPVPTKRLPYPKGARSSRDRNRICQEVTL